MPDVIGCLCCHLLRPSPLNVRVGGRRGAEVRRSYAAAEDGRNRSPRRSSRRLSTGRSIDGRCSDASENDTRRELSVDSIAAMVGSASSFAMRLATCLRRMVTSEVGCEAASAFSATFAVRITSSRSYGEDWIT